MAKHPVKHSTTLDLKSLNFTEGCFKFETLTMEGGRFVCIRENEGSELSVAIIDMHNNNSVIRKPIRAESAIMNPSEVIIALKAQMNSSYFIQVFHLETKEKLGNYQFDENIIFWRWISKNELALVTDNSVYHWAVGKGDPRVVFERSGKISDPNTKLVGYSVDKDIKWCLIYGIYSMDQGATVDGAIQLYSTERRQQQLFEGYAGTFGEVRVSMDSLDKTRILVFCEHKRGVNRTKLHIMDVYTQKEEGSPSPLKVSADVEKSADAPNDFPISIHILDSIGLVCILTKNGFAHFHHVATAKYLFTQRVSDVPVFVSSDKKVGGYTVGVLVVNKSGKIIEVTIDEDNLLESVQHLDDVALGLATCYGLKGSEKHLAQLFESYFKEKKYKQSALIAATCKSNDFRDAKTIERFKNAPNLPGQPSPASIYFSVLLEHGKLNALESVELLRPVVAQGRNELIKKWMDDGKLTESEELADLVRQIDQSIAFRIYTRIPNHMKAMLCLIEAGKVSKVVPYIKKVAEAATVSYTTSGCGDKVAVVEGLPSVFTLVENVISSQPKDLVTFLSDLIAGLGKDDVLCDVSKLTELLIRHNKLQELATVLLDYLKPNLPQHSALQTRLLEICLQNEPKIAATIMQLDVLTHFDKPYIARLCEDCGLYDIALQCYTKLSDFQRVISKSGGEVSQGVLENALTSLGPEDAYEILRYMLVTAKSLDYVVSLSLSLHKKIGALKLANMFESVGSTGALFSYLRSLPVISKGVTEVTEENSQLVYKFIECAIVQGETVDLERVCKDSNCYDLVRVKDLLKHSHLSDPKSLMIVCNRLGAVGELTEYLYQNGFDKFIEVYVNTINPSGVSTVISTLFDLGAPDDAIFSILSDLRDIGGIKAMIKVAEERHQLVLMQNWLESRVSEGFNEPEIHTALAKIYISTQNNAEAFLRSNRYYDREVVGLFCESCDPQLAFLIYSESENDEKLSKLCAKNAMYKQLASYAFKRQSLDFWCKIFKEVDDPSRVTDEVISMAAECTSTSSISCVIKAFMECGMNEQLIAILEKLLLSQADFSSNPNLQNLLLATTIKTNPEKLELYLTKLENYEVNPLAKMSNELGLHRCTFLIYSYSKRYLDALNALLCINLDEAKEYVSKLNMSELWFRLGRAYLDERMLKEAIEAYLKSGNLSDHALIRRECTDDELFLNWLREARKIKSTRDVDADLLVCLAKAGESEEFSKILNGRHSADLNVVGDTLMELGLYKEAVKLYSTIPNHAKLAICYINMDKYSEASDSALKSRNPKVLRNVLDVCLDKSKLEMANKVALDLLTFPEFLPGLIACYEKLGFIDDLIKLLESSTKSVALSTELAVLLAKYRPEKLMNYLEETFTGKMTSACLNIGKVARECCNLWLWKEAVYLYSINDLDKALLSMIVHAPLAWDPDVFFSCLRNVTNTEVIYRSLHFLIQQKPLLIEELFRAIRIKLDMSRLTKIMRNANCLALAREFLERADRAAVVNDALFEIYVEENQWDLLEKEVGKYDDFDHQKLCKLLEVHHLPQMRAIGAIIYCKQRNFSKAALIYNKNENHSAAIDAARSSRNELVVMDLLNKFIAANLIEEFVACLVVNYTLVNPADVLELAWLSNVDKDAIMPFLIQTLRTLHSNNGYITRDKYPQISYR